MSASRERKDRANSNSVAQPKKQEKKKVSEGLILAISVIAILVAVFGTIWGIRFYQRNQTVMTIGDKELTVKEFNYFFNQTASSFGNYASYVGIDTNRTIDTQKVGSENVGMMSMQGMDTECLAPYKQEDGTYDITWAGYFALLAKETAAQTWAVYQAAMDDPNYKVSEEVETAISNELLNLDFYSQINQMEVNDFIEAQYGNGCDRENYEQHIRVSYIASDYASNYEFNAADIDSKYTAAPADFDVVSYLVYTASASDHMPKEEATEEAAEAATEEEAENDAALEEAKAKAKEAAEKMAENFEIEGNAVKAFTDQTLDVVKSAITDEAGTWMFETAKVGDVKLFENAETDTYYVVKLLSNDVNYQSINALQIFIAKDEETEAEAEDHTGHDHAEGEGHEDSGEIPETLTAAEKLEAVKAGLEADGSEESFRELATKHSSSSSVELEDAAYSYLQSSISKDALLWAMEERKAGDYEVFETSTGTYVLYFQGNGETYRNLKVNADLVNEWIETLTATTVANCKFDLDAALNGGVEVKLTNQNAGY